MSMTTGERIKKKREELGLSKAELASKLGISQVAMGYYEKGRNGPKKEISKKMAILFGVTLDWLYGSTENEHHVVLSGVSLPKQITDAGVEAIALLNAYIDDMGGIPEDVLKDILRLIEQAKVLRRRKI
jgi:transcriptional regulator with XRE-family HTH domain